MLYRKIDAMHKRYGRNEMHICAECSHFERRMWGNTYFKCEVYGLSCSTASDWAKKWTACGMFNVPCEPNEGRAIFIKEKDSEVMDGQIELQEAQHEDT